MWIATVVPILIVGTYDATVEPVQLGQVESLIGIPLYLARWCSTRAGDIDARRARFVAAGVAGGMALVFKLVFAPIVVAIWLVAIVSGARRDGRFHSRSRCTARSNDSVGAGTGSTSGSRRGS